MAAEIWKTSLLCENEQSLSLYAFWHLGVAIESVECKIEHFSRSSDLITHLPTEVYFLE